MKRNTSIEDYLKPLSEVSNQAYLSNTIQVADILDWIIEQVGKCEVWQTTFSISEEFLRRLYFIEKAGKVKNFYLVLDHKATNKTLKLWNFICQVIDKSYLADNHSKILLVKAESGETVSVITSQNLTRGNRSESAFISCEHSIFNTLHSQINDLITNHSVPLNELLGKRLAAD